MEKIMRGQDWQPSSYIRTTDGELMIEIAPHRFVAESWLKQKAA